MPELAEFVYVDTALGALNPHRERHVRRLSEIDFKDWGPSATSAIAVDDRVARVDADAHQP